LAGKIQKLIGDLVQLRANGRAGLTHFVRAHLVLSGIDPDQFDESSADDPEIVARLEKMITDFKRAR
jgi:hypothetical protein